MSVEELRAGFDRIAGAVTSDVDPYEAVLRRARRRRRRLRGLGAAVAVLATMALAAPAALTAGGPDDPPRPDAPAGPFQGFPVTSPWTWRLIDSPTRGNLANDQALIQGVVREFAHTGISNGLDLVGTAPSIKVLFAHDFTDWRTVALAYYSESDAMLVTRTARRGASAAQLAGGSGVSSSWLDPFTIVGQSLGLDNKEWWTQFWLGLAPRGCTVDTSTDGVVQPDGTVRRTWQPSPYGDYVLSEDFPPAAQWRVTCDGVVRFQSSAAWQGQHDDGVAKPDEMTPAVAQAARGTVDPATAGTALAAYRGLTEHAGLRGGGAVVRWGGSVPGANGTATPAVLVSQASGTGPAVLQVGDSTSFMVAVGRTPQPRPYLKPDNQDYLADMSWTATTPAASSELMAVRVPGRKDLGAVPTDNLLVLAPPATAQVEAVADGRQVWKASPLANGAGVFDIRHRGDVTLRALDQHGALLATAPLHDPPSGDHLFGEKLVDSW